MANRYPDRFEQIAQENVEKIERSLLLYLRSDNPRVAKACFKTLKKKYPLLRDMVHAGVIDGSVNTIVSALDIMFYRKP